MNIFFKASNEEQWIMDPKDQEERPAAALEKGIYSLLNPRQNYLNHTVAVYSLLFSLAIYLYYIGYIRNLKLFQ
jgi:uncharacterized membrane protein YcjF (UPF0283 family)